MVLDKDLQSIQEVRDLVRRAKAAQYVLKEYSQTQIDSIVKTIALACEQNAERLAKMAVEETGFGIWQDKVAKNLLGSRLVYEYIKDLITIGILNEDQQNKIIEVAVPVGVVAALVPSTNPTSTTMFKSLISVKSGNSIVFSPHPSARNCILETVKIISEAAEKAGAPKDTIQCITLPTLEATNELMSHRDTGIILATGGPAMVKAAYSSGNPALGVGAGNGPAFIERTADIGLAVKRILDSKTFDNGTVCASEQSVVTESCIKDKVRAEFKKQGAYFLNAEESKKVGAVLLRPNGTMNPAIVGKSVTVIAEMADITVPEGARVIISEQTEVGEKHPYSREKLCPVLAFFVEDSWEKACERCIEILYNEGAGHTMTIHSKDERLIKEFALKKPISRLLVNTPASFGGVGLSTNLIPSLTLGSGAVGGSATSDNVGPLNLINIRRVAYGVKEREELDLIPVGNRQEGKFQEITGSYSRKDIERITREVINKLLNN